MSGFSRDTYIWLQGLDLSYAIRNEKWDFSNGFLVAEILSRYFPNEISLASYDTGIALSKKMDNWDQIKKFLEKHGVPVPQALIEQVIHCKPGAVRPLMDYLYSILTSRKATRSYDNPTLVTDFTDRKYQESLPGFARATASKSIKNNIANSELEMYPDILYSVQKAQKIVQLHVEDKRRDKEISPGRYSIKKTGFPSSVAGPYSLYTGRPKDNNDNEYFLEEEDEGEVNYAEVENMNFKEISVKQHNRN
eukprot:Nk52_evm6s490 gene=Nk52_evmTU6s490